MIAGRFYKGLLWLYPVEFRERFSEEMLCVFEQRAVDRFANRKSGFTFLVTEFSSILKGAYLMWLGRIVSMNRKPVPAQETGSLSPSLTLADAIRERDSAIKNMVAAIANHDFSNARHYSEEEVRFKTYIENLQAQSGERIDTA
jgi:hypothetical protein